MDLTQRCRHCGHSLQANLIDLGKSPLCQTFLTSEQLDEMEAFYPLQVKVCDNCWLVQVDEYVTPAELFANYEYYSSYSTAWLEHARSYVEMAIDRFGLTKDSYALKGLGEADQGVGVAHRDTPLSERSSLSSVKV